MTRKTEFQRFVEKIRPPKDPMRDCWEWIGARTGCGYGALKILGRMQLAHRYSYAMGFGDVPSGKQIDHLCRNRSCVNPAHLEAVDPGENVSRGMLGAMRPGKTSRFVGVHWSPRHRAWKAKARGHYLGYFKSEEEAAKTCLDFVEALIAR